MARKAASAETLPRNIRRKGDGYELRMARKGYPAVSLTFDILDKAIAEKKRIELHIDEGKAPPNIKARKFSVSDAMDEYLQHYTDISKTRLSAIELVRSDIGHLKVLELNHRGVAKYLKAKLEEDVPPPWNKKTEDFHPLYNGEAKRKRSGATVRKYFYALKTVLEWHAVQHTYELPPKLLDGHDVPAAWAKERERRLEDGEEKRLLDACDRMRVRKEEWKRLIQLALETAMRTQEIVKICWKDVNLEQRYINIPAEIVKTRTARQVPLSKKAGALLKEHKPTMKTKEDRVFWQWTGPAHVSHSFKRITKNAGCVDLRFHDLRHEATSRLFERTSLSMMEVAAMTGHTDLKTLKRYIRLRPQILAEKLDKPAVARVLR
jgi:integrase